MASPSAYSGILDPDSQGGFTTPALADGESTTFGFGQLAPGASVLTVSGPHGLDVSNITSESCAAAPTTTAAATTPVVVVLGAGGPAAPATDPPSAISSRPPGRPHWASQP